MAKKPFLIIVLLTMLVPAAFAADYDLYLKSGQRSPQWDGMIKAGFQSYDSGDVLTGLVFLQKAYNLGCRDGLLLFKMGLYYETKKDYKQAEKYFNEAAEKLAQQYPDYPETKKMHEHLARLYYQTDQFDKALPEIEEALKTAPDSFMLLFMSAQIYRVQKNYTQAIANFEKALTAPSPYPSPSRGEGKGGGDPKKIVMTELMALYYEMKDYGNCLKYAEMILQVFPKDRAALSYRQQIQQMQYKQREQEAIKKIIQ